MCLSWEHGRLTLQGHRSLGSPKHAVFVGSDQVSTPREAEVGGRIGTEATPVQEHPWLERRGRNDGKSGHVSNCPLSQWSVMEDT